MQMCCISGWERPFSRPAGPFVDLSGLFVVGIGLVLLLLTGTFPPPSHGQAPPSPLRATDLYRIETIRDVELSPSGRNAAYTVRRTVPQHDGDRADRLRLYVSPTYGREQPRQLTRTARNARQPAWHPDGNQLAFVRPVQGTPQIFLLSLSGGEPYQLTDAPHGATHPRWSPSGDRLLYASSVPEPALRRRTGTPPPSERPGRSPLDTVRRLPPDTLLVLRDAQTLDPVDTLTLGPGALRLRADTARTLRVPEGRSVPASLRSLPIDSLRALSSDSLRTVFDRLRMLPDTTTLPVAPDTTARPDGSLLQIRRWLDQGDTRASVVTRPRPHERAGFVSPPRYRHYFSVPVPERATLGNPPRPSPTPVTRGYRSYGGADWLPGGSQIVVSAPPTDRPHPDRVEARALYIVDLSPYRITRLLRIDGYALTDPRVTTDGTTLAFRARALSPRYEQAEIGLFELDGRSAPKLITGGFDHDITDFRWSPDGWYLYVTSPEQGGRPLYRFAPFARDDTTDSRDRTSLRDDYATSHDTFSLTPSMVRTAVHDRVLDSRRVVQAFDVTDSNALYAALGPENPSELYSNTISFNNEQRLTSHNRDWATRRRLASSEWIRAWSGRLQVHGRLTRPPGVTDSVQVPLVVMPRGGPAALDAAQPASLWAERQYLAGQGFGVLEVWPRGSVGYGHRFRQSNFQNWGPGPAEDVLTLADSATERGWIDSTQVAVAGRSYGGLLTAWLLGRTDRFAAGVAQGGVYDLSAFYGSSAASDALPAAFGGLPWDSTLVAAPRTEASLVRAGLLPSPDSLPAPRAALRRSSPASQVSQITTPLLLLHGTQDAVAPPQQAEALYRRLKVRERPVEYVQYPGVGHEFAAASPAQRVDRLVRIREFLRRFIVPASAPSSPGPPQAQPGRPASSSRR